MKAGQFYNGTNWQQFGLTTDDITISGGVYANLFNTIKDKDDTLYVLAYRNQLSINSILIKITKDGIKTRCVLTGGSFGDANPRLTIDRSSSVLLFGYNRSVVRGICSVSFSSIIDGATISPSIFFSTDETTYTNPFAIYKDLYIWVASGSTVKIYDYTTKALLDTATSITIPSGNNLQSVTSVCLSTDNKFYVIGACSDGGGGGQLSARLFALTFDGLLISDTIESIAYFGYGSAASNYKQLLIDPFGDLIILTNSGTVSTLLKYTTAGTQIGTTLTLSAPSYNLSIDSKGNYYYQTALATFKIEKNTEQGQPFNAIPTEPIRGTGNTGFGSNFTGYQPSVYN